MENGNNCNGELVSPRRLAPSASFKAKKKPIVPNSVSRPGSEADDFINQLHGSDPLRVELTRLENDLKDKDRDLGEAQAEIKALRYSERLKERAVEELTDELQKVDEKLKATEALLENKNLEIKKINEEKKASLAAQFAAEATLRRVHAAQKDDDMPPIEAIIAPLEAELKLARSEIAKLQDDNRALDRLTKSKESALLEVEKTVQLAMAKAAMVDDLQNKNQELMKQIEICQEENKILDKMHRQKVADVEKLMQSVHELEEAVLAGGAAANAVREYQRKVQEMNEEKRILDRELARTKISANRVAVVVANEWKDGNDKVMPVKQWLEERRFLQGEMQQLKDKLTVAERTAKAEAQLKEKYQLRFKVLEERLKAPPNGSNRSVPEGRSLSKGQLHRKSFEGLNLFRPSTNGISLRKSSTLPRNTANSLLNQDTSMSGSSNDSNTSLDNGNVSLVVGGTDNGSTSPISDIKTNDTISTHENGDGCLPEITKIGSEDFVSGVLYDMLQREVIALRKACHAKDRSLNDKEDAIEMLAKKVETLNRAMEVEAKKTRREMSAMEKEVATLRNGKEQDRRLRNGGISRSRGSMNGSIFK